MSQNFKILFFLKKGKGNNQRSIPIYVRVTVNGNVQNGPAREIVIRSDGISKQVVPRAIRKR